jgi:hypothetical protein
MKNKSADLNAEKKGFIGGFFYLEINAKLYDRFNLLENERLY